MNTQKIAIALMSILSLTSFSYSPNADSCPYGIAPRQAGVQMVDALRMASAEAYLQAFPTLDELLALMEQNNQLYGAHFEAAKQELAGQYVAEIVPAAYESFERLLKQGEARGVVWSEVEFVRWEVATREQTRWDEIPFLLIVQFREREYKIAVRAVVINGQLRFSQYLKLQ